MGNGFTAVLFLSQTRAHGFEMLATSTIEWQVGWMLGNCLSFPRLPPPLFSFGLFLYDLFSTNCNTIESPIHRR